MALLALVALIALGLSAPLLTAQLLAAQRSTAALQTLQIKRNAPGLWRWLPDDARSPRALEGLRRSEITAQYRAALQEVGYAAQSADPSGLRTYFQRGALEDALLAAQTNSVQADWGHELQLRFYAPDGATVALTDRAWIGYELDGQISLRRQVSDVVLRLDDGNWRVHHWRVTATSPADFKPLPTNPVFNAELSALRGVNYVGRDHPFAGLWLNFNALEVRSSLRAASALGFNSLRVFVPYPMPDGLERKLATLLMIAQQQRLRVIVTLLDSYTRYALEDLPGIHANLERLLPALRHPAVWAIDVKNEAERDAPTAGWGRVHSVLGFVAGWLRSQTARPITAGLSDPDPVLSAKLDFVTVHHYGSLTALTPRLASAATTGKPVLLEEIGFHTQLDKFPDPHTELEQLSYLTGALQIAGRAGVGVMLWNLHDFTGGAMPGGREVERHLGLLRADGSKKPAASLLLGVPLPDQGQQPWLPSVTKWLAVLRAAWWLPLTVILALLLLWLTIFQRSKHRQ